jgi:transcriptional regulator with XRE-family HTH domain
MKAYSQADIIELLRKAIGDGTAKDYAAKIGVSQQFLSDVLKGRRAPGHKLLAALGLKAAYVPEK